VSPAKSYHNSQGAGVGDAFREAERAGFLLPQGETTQGKFYCSLQQLMGKHRNIDKAGSNSSQRSAEEG